MLDEKKALSIGRDPSNQLVVPDPLVSRQHARVDLTPGGPVIVDLKSRHGLRVNGAPRRQCSLSDGDQIEIGSITLKVVDERPANVPAFDRAAWLKTLPGHDGVTLPGRVPLPENPVERQLATLTHACFWLAEGVDEAFFRQRCLAILMDGLQAEEVQYYGADGSLLHVEGAAARKGKPLVKFAPYLAQKMSALQDVTRFTAKDFGRLQEHLGDYNYLIAPLRAGSFGPGDAIDAVPFIVLFKSREWQNFSGKDAVLLQAVTALWMRATVRALAVAELRKENSTLKSQADGLKGKAILLGESPAIAKIREQIRRLALTNATVLITGETGTGKEVAAQLIHESSPRTAKAFVKLNCAAIPEGLIESELFGHVKGAFTDAKSDREGKFQQADSGTLFLDEIGEMPLSVQAKVLRALESGEVEKVGGKGPKKVNVRVVAATHRDLKQLVAAGRFREDLYFRLNVLALRMPSLREHPEDLPILATEFLKRFVEDNGLATLTWSSQALRELTAHPWPGNVRELRNIVQRCAALTNGAQINSDEVESALKT